MRQKDMEQIRSSWLPAGRVVLLLTLGILAAGCDNSTTENTPVEAAGEGQVGAVEAPETDTAIGGEETEPRLSVCGNEDCTSDEDCKTCPEDCGGCPPVEACGDSECSSGEDCTNCPEDCGLCETLECGDGTCSETENCEECPEDCGPCATMCGDGQCASGEDCASCSLDCGDCPGVCGDGTCGEEESCSTCPSDCGVCPDSCGDETCGTTEDCTTCEEDCGDCPLSCGNGTCDEDESCSECPGDCGPCDCASPGLESPFPPGSICKPSGCKGGFIDCPVRVARMSEDAEAPSALQFSVLYDPTLLVMENFYDEVCFAEDFCSVVPLAKSMAKGNKTNHTFTMLPPGEAPPNPTPGQSYAWNGVVHVIVANFAGAEIVLSDAYVDASGEIQGDPAIAWIRFQLAEEIAPETPALVSLATADTNDLVAAGESLVDLPATVEDGVIIIQKPE